MRQRQRMSHGGNRRNWRSGQGHHPRNYVVSSTRDGYRI